MKTEIREVKRIGVISSGKIGFFFGIIFWLASILMTWVLPLAYSQQALAAMNLTIPAFTWLTVLVLLIQSLIAYTIIAIIASSLYNLFAMMVGGIKLKLD